MSERIETYNIIFIGIPKKRHAVFIEEFEKAGHKSFPAYHGGEIIEAILKTPIDCVILGPGMGHILKEIRTVCTVPCLSILCKNCIDTGGAEKVIHCDGKASTQDIVKAAIEIIDEENKDISSFKGAVRYGDFVINMDRYLASIENKSIKLKPMEMRILFYMMKLRERVVSREQLMNKVWRYESKVNTRTIDVHMMNLRQNLERYDLPFRILTLRGVGYRLADKNPKIYSE